MEGLSDKNDREEKGGDIWTLALKYQKGEELIFAGKQVK